MKQILLALLIVFTFTTSSFAEEKIDTMMKELQELQLKRDLVARALLYNKIKNDKNSEKYFEENLNQKALFRMIGTAIKCEVNK